MSVHIKKVVLVSLICCFIAGGIAQGGKTVERKDGIFATLETNRGNIVMELYFKNTPLTVCNFIGLAEGTINNTHVGPGEPYFDGMKWHRVVPNWVIQTGCPYGTGTGDPGYSFQCEIDTPALMHDKAGVVGMANSGAGTATNGSQFYITHEQGSQYDRLNGGYTIFGQVLGDSCMDVVLAIRKDDRLDRVTIERVGAEAEAFRTDQDAFDSLLVWVTGIHNKSPVVARKYPFTIQARNNTVSFSWKRSGVADIELFTVNGRRLFFELRKKFSEGNSCKIPHTFEPGMYIATVKLGNNRFTQKLIIQR